MILADKIILLRKQNAWSQEELAEKLGVSRQAVSKWEGGNSIPDLDKVIRMSKLFGVSTDYLLKDELETLSPDVDVKIEEGDGVRSVSLEEAHAFMELTELTTPRIALGVALCITSPVCLILLGGLEESGKVSGNMAGGLGVIVLLLMIAAAVAIFILNGISLSKYDYMEKEPLDLEYGVRGIVEKKKEAFEKKYRTGIAGGVAACILGVVPLLLAAALNASELICVIMVDVLLLMIAGAVYTFIYVGSIYDSYQQLLEEGDYTPEKKAEGRRTELFSRIYWCIIVAVYLFISFYTMRWDRTWIIWPVAGVAYGAAAGIANMILTKK